MLRVKQLARAVGLQFRRGTRACACHLLYAGYPNNPGEWGRRYSGLENWRKADADFANSTRDIRSYSLPGTSDTGTCSGVGDPTDLSDRDMALGLPVVEDKGRTSATEEALGLDDQASSF